MSDLEELKNEAADLGIKHSNSIGAEKLQEKINEFYESQETSGPAIIKAVESKAVEDTKDKELTRKERVALKYKEAKKTRIISIVDNDQRSNNHTTTCIVNCSNEFFDLGTRVLPLNESIEVAQGHINVLKKVKITLHAKDNKTGLSVSKTRLRYSISYEDR